MKEEIELYYQKEAKMIIDSMFDCKVFNEKITRDDMQKHEDFIAFLFQSHDRMTRKATELTISLKHLK